jgi:hypothetical protein
MSKSGGTAQMNDKKSMPIRIGLEALDAAKIAAAYKGVSVMEYVTDVLPKAADHDIEKGHRSRGLAKAGATGRQKAE